MKIALIGYGKTARFVEQLALEKGHAISSRFSKKLGMVQERLHELKEADIAIDFSQASGVIENLEQCLSLNKPIVIGTTGWEDQLSKAKQLVSQSHGSCLYSPNFSIGVYLFREILGYAASLFDSYPEYDVCGFESHHRHKLDAPSGTAKALTETIIKNMPRISKLEFTSIRSGYNPGTHTVQFDSPCDTVTLTHQARNRQGIAEGVLFGAKWLSSRKGFFSMDDMMEQVKGEQK